MADVEQLELTMAAAGLMRGYRQSKRIWRRYRDDGDARLMHQLRGKLGDINVKRFKTMKAALQEEHSVAPATERTQTNPFAAPGVNIYKTRDGYTPEPELPGVQRRRQNDPNSGS